MFTLVLLDRHLSDISEGEWNQPRGCNRPPTLQTKRREHFQTSTPNGFSLGVHSNGCCITHSDMSGARPSLWQRRSLPRPPIQKPTAGKLRPFQVHRAATEGKSVHNVNKVSCVNERNLDQNAQSTFYFLIFQPQMINKIDCCGEFSLS